jgi:hypothetical protein
MKKLGLLLLAAPLGYAVLTGVLVVRVRPLPVGLLSSAHAPKDAAPERLAA